MVPQFRLPAPAPAAAAAAAVGSRRHFVTTVLWSPAHKIGVAVTGCASTGLAYEWSTALREPDWMGVANLWEGFGLCRPYPSSGPKASALLGCAVNGLDELIQGEMRLPIDRSFAKPSRPMRPGRAQRQVTRVHQPMAENWGQHPAGIGGRKSAQNFQVCWKARRCAELCQSHCVASTLS